MTGQGPWPGSGLSLQQVLQLSQEAEEQVPGEFSSLCQLQSSLPCQPWARAGPGRSRDSREMPVSGPCKKSGDSGRPWLESGNRGELLGAAGMVWGHQQGHLPWQDLEGRERNLVPEL